MYGGKELKDDDKIFSNVMYFFLKKIPKRCSKIMGISILKQNKTHHIGWNELIIFLLSPYSILIVEVRKEIIKLL